jgi:hypothetical protein
MAFRTGSLSLAPAAPAPSPADTERAVRSKAAAVLEALKNREFDRLAGFVHPKQGLRFAPYAFLSPSDRIVTRKRVAGLLADLKEYVWGTADGSGEPIRRDFARYYEQFVYSADFLSAPEVAYNRLIKTGNTPSNIVELYPGSGFMEYHFPGFDPRYQGMDWESLRLVFQKEKREWYLVAIVHDEWTI